jgi:probable F420-dependent oxidoreductase
MPEKRRYWGVVPPVPAPVLGEMARQQEALGLEGVWSYSVWGPPFAALAAAAMVTSRVKLGTGVALGFVRSPVDTALAALDLDTISGGRVVLGIGPSVRILNENWFGVRYGKPIPHLREVIRIVRTVVAKAHTGDLGTLRGEYYDLDFTHFEPLPPPVRTNIPIYMPAVYETAIRVAAEIADGLFSHPIWCEPWILERVERNLRKGLEKSGRRRDEFDLNIGLWVAPGPNKRECIEDARATTVFYARFEQYERYYAESGFGEEARAIRAAFEAGDTDGAMRACPDRMVEHFNVVGTPDEVRTKVDRIAKIADSLTLGAPFRGLPPEKIGLYSQRIAETFYV